MGEAVEPPEKRQTLSQVPDLPMAPVLEDDMPVQLESEAKRARIAKVSAEQMATVDDLEEIAGADEAMEEAWVEGDPDLRDVAAEELEKNRDAELDKLESFGAFTEIGAEHTKGKKFLTMRWVDTEEKSRLVVREFASEKRDDLFAAASTHTTHLLVDLIAAVFLFSRAIGDIARAFLHVPEDEEVYSRPPEH